MVWPRIAWSIIGAIGVLATAAEACNSDGPSHHGAPEATLDPTDPGAAVATMHAADAGPGDVGAPLRTGDNDKARAERATAGANAFAFDVYRVLARGKSDFAISPASTALALTMMSAGARGATLAELAAALHSHPDTVVADYGALSAAITATAQTGPSELDVASSVWFQRGLTLKPDFSSVLARFAAAAIPVDFESYPADASALVDAWAAKQTRDRIEDFVPSSDLDRDTRLMVANLAYLRDPWKFQFDPSKTHPEHFFGAGGAMDAPMMHMQEGLLYGHLDQLQFVELPYASGRSIMILLPDRPDGLEALEKDLAQTFPRAVRSHYFRAIDLKLPRWLQSTTLPCTPALASLGVHALAGDGAADLSGISDEPALHVARLLHRALVRVDEKGIGDAAAATEGVVRPSVLWTRWLPFHVDHPFVYVIREKSTGLILFAGRVTRPRSP
jgi:serpin B